MIVSIEVNGSFEWEIACTATQKEPFPRSHVSADPLSFGHAGALAMVGDSVLACLVPEGESASRVVCTVAILVRVDDEEIDVVTIYGGIKLQS